MLKLPFTESTDFEDMIQRAFTLPEADRRRHASVSTNNRHECESCFTCACAAAQRRIDRLDRINGIEIAQRIIRRFTK
jgi:hypothetical protein